MKTKNFEMFTPEGNYMVGRIVEAGLLLKQTDPVEQVWAWTNRELSKLGSTDEFGEATDTAVREAVYEAVVES